MKVPMTPRKKSLTVELYEFDLYKLKGDKQMDLEMSVSKNHPSSLYFLEVSR